jgi:hypothetical protein
MINEQKGFSKIDSLAKAFLFVGNPIYPCT